MDTTPRLEHKDDTIPLGGKKMRFEVIEQHVNPLIQERLHALVPESWETEYSTWYIALRIMKELRG